MTDAATDTTTDAEALTEEQRVAALAWASEWRKVFSVDLNPEVLATMHGRRLTIETGEPGTASFKTRTLYVLGSSVLGMGAPELGEDSDAWRFSVVTIEGNEVPLRAGMTLKFSDAEGEKHTFVLEAAE